ncbi:MAG: hypothetical protein ACAF41_11925 [Leptolyngbya sp. BL-A-14]
MTRKKQSEPDVRTRAQIILEACDRYNRSQLLEKLAQAVREIAPELTGEAGERIRALLKELDENPAPPHYD